MGHRASATSASLPCACPGAVIGPGRSMAAPARHSRTERVFRRPRKFCRAVITRPASAAESRQDDSCASPAHRRAALVRRGRLRLRRPSVEEQDRFVFGPRRAQLYSAGFPIAVAVIVLLAIPGNMPGGKGLAQLALLITAAVVVTWTVRRCRRLELVIDSHGVSSTNFWSRWSLEWSQLEHVSIERFLDEDGIPTQPIMFVDCDGRWYSSTITSQYRLKLSTRQELIEILITRARDNGVPVIVRDHT